MAKAVNFYIFAEEAVGTMTKFTKVEGVNMVLSRQSYSDLPDELERLTSQARWAAADLNCFAARQ